MSFSAVAFNDLDAPGYFEVSTIKAFNPNIVAGVSREKPEGSRMRRHGSSLCTESLKRAGRWQRIVQT